MDSVQIIHGALAGLRLNENRTTINEGFREEKHVVHYLGRRGVRNYHFAAHPSLMILASCPSHFRGSGMI